MLVRGLEILTRMLSTGVKKREREKICWLKWLKGLCILGVGWLPNFTCLVSRGSPQSVYCDMTRNLQRNRQGVATCQQKLFRNQMEKLFLSLSPSISLWPRYFCSLKSLAKLGPYYSCTSKYIKKRKKKTASQNLSKYLVLVFSSPNFSLLQALFSHLCKTCVLSRFCFTARHLFLCCLISYLIPFSYSLFFSVFFCNTSLCSFIHLHSSLHFLSTAY